METSMKLLVTLVIVISLLGGAYGISLLETDIAVVIILSFLWGIPHGVLLSGVWEGELCF